MSPERAELSNYISNAYKDAYGCRPRHYDYMNTPIEELEAIATGLSDAVVETIERENEEYADAVKKFNDSVDMMVSRGARDFEQGIRWVLDSDSVNPKEDDLAYYFWEQGLPFDFIDDTIATYFK